MKIERFENLYNELVTPFQDGRRDKMLPHRLSHEFKFVSTGIALNTISDEPISMNQIFVEPISTNQIFVEHGSMNQIFLERGSTKSVCSSLAHLSNSDSTYLSHSIFTYLIYHNFFRIPFLRIYSTKGSFQATFLRIFSTINLLSHPGQNHFYVSSWHIYSFVSLTFHSTYLLDRKYSFSPWTKPFLRTYLTHIFFRILDIPFLRIYLTINILSHPQQNHFYVPTQLNDILSCVPLVKPIAAYGLGKSY